MVGKLPSCFATLPKESLIVNTSASPEPRGVLPQNRMWALYISTTHPPLHRSITMDPCAYVGGTRR